LRTDDSANGQIANITPDPITIFLLLFSDISFFSIFLREIYWDAVGNPTSIKLSSDKFEYLLKADKVVKKHAGKVIATDKSNELISIIKKSDESAKKELTGELKRTPNASLRVELEKGQKKTFFLYLDSAKCKLADGENK
jgi:hypothetical protein